MSSCSQYLTRAIRSCGFVAEAARFCFGVKAEADAGLDRRSARDNRADVGGPHRARSASVGDFNSGNRDALAAVTAPNAEIVPMRAALEGTVFSGENAFTDFWR